jgi:predicted nucleic acid-binding protein
MPSPIRIQPRDLGVTADRGLVDTSVVVATDRIDRKRLPGEIAISALTLAELTGGPHATEDPLERARRQELLQRVEAGLETLPFDPDCARSFGRICAATTAAGRKVRGSRAVDLMIAATALSYRLPLFTLNGADLRGLDGLIEIVDLS